MKYKLLYGTRNEAKLGAMQRRLASLDIELVGLTEVEEAMHLKAPIVKESGNSPLENACLKAEAYYQAFRMPVFSCDSGLYFDEVTDEDQPGVHVRCIEGKTLTDEEMVKYYVNLYAKYGKLTARYKNAICLYLDETQFYSEMAEDMESAPFYITDQMRQIRKSGFPIDSISVDIKSGKHFYDIAEEKVDRIAVEDGFIRFFSEIVKLL